MVLSFLENVDVDNGSVIIADGGLFSYNYICSVFKNVSKYCSKLKEYYITATANLHMLSSNIYVSYHSVANTGY